MVKMISTTLYRFYTNNSIKDYPERMKREGRGEICKEIKKKMKPSRRSRRSEGYNEKPEVVLSRKWRWRRKSAFLSTGPFVTCCQPRYLFKTHKKEVWPDYQVWKGSLHPSASSHPRSHSSHYLRGLRTLTPLFFFTFSSSLWETEKKTAHHFTYTYIYIYIHTHIYIWLCKFFQDL